MISVIDLEPPPTTENRPAAGNVARLTALRSLLEEKFPAQKINPRGILPTGLQALDAAEGGLRRGSLTEIVGSLSAGSLLLTTILSILSREHCFAALVDGSRSFAPQDYQFSSLNRLLWVLCADCAQAIKSADLLLRDANLALIVLDLQMIPRRELQRIPASTWHRFQRVVEKTDVVFAVLSCQPVVEGAAVRIAAQNRGDLRTLRQRRSQLLAALELQVFTRSTLSVPMQPAHRRLA